MYPPQLPHVDTELLAGFGNAALQLSRVWNRDPDSLPFASNVQPHTLIHLLQDGLWFDKLQAEATNVRLSISMWAPF
jgi:hypothetical protein